jgi:hypothetical protein
MSTWTESIKFFVTDEEGNDVEMELETDAEGFLYISLQPKDAAPKFIGSLKTKLLLDALERAKTMWKKEAEEVEEK